MKTFDLEINENYKKLVKNRNSTNKTNRCNEILQESSIASSVFQKNKDLELYGKYHQ